MQNTNTPLVLGAARMGLLAGRCASRDAISRDSAHVTIRVNHGLVSHVQQVDVTP